MPRPLRHCSYFFAVFFVAALAMLSPAPAQAHTGHEHPAVEQESEQGAAPAASKRGVVRDLRPCPDTPAHLCGCGNLVPCSSGKPAAISAAPFSLQQVSLGSRVALPRARLSPSSAPFPTARPRAPPAVS